MHTPPPAVMPPGPFISGGFSAESRIALPLAGAITTGATTINRAHFLPVLLTEPYTVRRFWWANGATVGTDSILCGVYADNAGSPGNRLVQGNSTLSAGASVVQFDDITDFVLGAGPYWLAMIVSGGTATFQYHQPVTLGPKYYQAQGSFSLPSPANATSTASTVALLFGITSRATP